MSDIRRRRPQDPETVAAGELERGRAAYARRAWADAYQSLSRADQVAPLGNPDLERLAWSAALCGRDGDLLKAFERLYHAHHRAGESVAAARWAFWLGFRLFSLGEMGQATGWLARAERLLEQSGHECVEQGYLLLPTAHRHLAAGDGAAAYAAAARAAEIGDRFADGDLGAFARSLQGMILLRQGDIRDGLALLDEAMLAATAGVRSPLITGLIYCSVIDCCQRVYALDRAREWTAVLAEWCDAQPQLVTFTGSCRAHRAEILQLQGEWGGAIEEAQRVTRRLADALDAEAIAPAYYQQAEIHRLRGEFASAEKAYRSASQFGREPQPGLALLRLAQGQGGAAASALRRVVAATPDPLRRTKYLPALVEVLLAVGDLDGARHAARELEEAAAKFDIPLLVAIAAHARGAVLLAEGNAAEALGPLRQAFDAWHQVGAPYLAARIRVLIGSACRALGDQEGAGLELDAARAVLEQLGAVPDLARIGVAGDGRRPRPAGGLTAREREVLRLVAKGKTNKTIAAELFVSEKTVDRHVSNIFVKLDVSSRAAATAYAYEHQLI